MRFRPRRGLTIFVAVFLPLVLSLAAWQDRRAAEKAVLEARLAAQDAQPAQRLEAWLSAGGGLGACPDLHPGPLAGAPRPLAG